MKRSGLFSFILVSFIVLVLISFSINLVSAGVEVHNYTFEKEYGQFEIIKGSVNISLSDVYLNELLESILEQKISLKDFLDNNSADYSCYTDDCKGSFEKAQGGTNLNYGFSNNGYFGFYIEEEGISISSIEFNLSSDFGKSSILPLKMKFFDSSEWQWDFVGEEYSDKDYGCYSSSSETTPIKESYFCEKISISNRNRVIVGADVIGSDNKALKMIISDGFTEGSCHFSPSEGESECEIKFENVLEGEYFVCLYEDGETNYEIYYGASEDSCGWTGSYNDFGLDSYEESSLDFAIYLKQPKYVNREIKFSKNIVDSLVDDANNYIMSKYGGNCSNGCFLPIYLNGINQNLKVNNVVIRYRDSKNLLKTETNVYSLTKDEPKLKSFKGILDLSLTEFEVGKKGSKNFRIELGGNTLISEKIKVNPSPIINYITPLNPAAGINIIFYADVDSDYNITKYEWDFGDNTSVISYTNITEHVYENFGAYTITLRVSDSGGFSSEKTFSVVAGNPQEVVPLLLNKTKNDLTRVKNQISLFPNWYKERVTKILDIANKESGLNTLEKKVVNAFEDEDFLEIALGLLDLKMPKQVYVSGVDEGPLIIDVDKIDASVVRDYAGGSGEMNEYRNPIKSWMDENTEIGVKIEQLSVDYGKNQEIIGYVYSYNLDVSGEGYLVILKPFENILFETQGAKKQGDSVIYPVSGEKTFKFFSQESVDAFVSPKLSEIILSYNIGVCNFNNICEKELGENAKNCSDCKNYFKAIIWVLIVLLFGLTVYTFLQEWYKRKYETYLFKDRNQLFNLLMFISNARARGMDDSEIGKLLKQKKWSGEKISYAIKKSRGQKVGMYELIPIERLFAWFRNRKAQKIVRVQEQQKMQNINKPVVGRINKW